MKENLEKEKEEEKENDYFNQKKKKWGVLLVEMNKFPFLTKKKMLGQNFSSHISIDEIIEQANTNKQTNIHHYQPFPNDLSDFVYY